MVEQQEELFYFDYDLEEFDHEVSRLIKLEEERQQRKIILIASESISPEPVRKCLGSVYTNIYAEGYPSTQMGLDKRELLKDHKHQMAYLRRYSDKRYYKGTEFADFAEALAQKRVAELFATENVPAEDIYANVQALSGAPANNAVFTAFLKPGDTVLSMALNCGGHLSHGSEVNRSGIFHKVIPYGLERGQDKLNYDSIEKLALEHLPRLIIAGYSAYPWDIKWDRLRNIADKVGDGCILLADVSHISAFIVAGILNNPIEHAHVVMFTTHKAIAGPRGAALLTTNPEHASLIDRAVFPGEQGGPHINNIVGQAVCFKIAATEQFRKYAEKVVENAKFFCEVSRELGLKIAYGGTETHLFLIDLKCLGRKNGYYVTGEIATRILDQIGITLNKNTISGDDNSNHPTGLRIGAPWITQRGVSKDDIREMAEIIDYVIRNIQPFHYEGMDDEIGRGKIKLEVLLKARKRTRDLIKRIHQKDYDKERGYPYYLNNPEIGGESPLMDLHVENGAEMEERCGWRLPFYKAESSGDINAPVIIDASCQPILRIRGDEERIRPFLGQMCTGEVLLDIDESTRTFVLDEKGNVIDDVLITRIHDPRQGFASYYMIGNAENAYVLREWIRGIADGYLIFDEEDIYRKVEGPAVVEDLHSDDDITIRRTCLVIIGDHTLKIAETIRNKYPGIITAYEKIAGKDVVHIITPLKSIEEIWSEVSIKAGLKRTDSLRKKEGLPCYTELGEGQAVIAKDIFHALPDHFALHKPYFVGQKPILNELDLEDGSIKEKKTWKWTEKEKGLQRTVLYQDHVELGGRMVPFAGWEMPVFYEGIMPEHKVVRIGAGLFDVSHMGVMDFTGKYVADFLDMLTTNYSRWIRPGQTQYAYILGPDGKVLDDIFIYRKAVDRYMMVVNAANADKIWSWVNAVNSGQILLDSKNPHIRMPEGIVIRNLKDRSSGDEMKIDLALQGPTAREILLSLCKESHLRELRELEKGDFVEVNIAGIEVMVARTGYTGEEIGYELFIHPDNACKLWRTLLEKGKEKGIAATGLGSRDSTRTEAGFPLYGHEIEGKLGVFPMENGYSQFLKLHKPFFIGRHRAVIQAQGTEMEIARFQMINTNIKMLNTGDPVANRQGRCVGYVASSVLVGDRQIGLAYLKKKEIRTGAKLNIFPLGRSGRAPKETPRNSWKPGDRTVIPEESVILTRFPEDGEMEDRAQGL